MTILRTLPHNLNAIYGALRLAIFDPRGLARFDDSRPAAIASFIVPLMMIFPLLYFSYDQAANDLTTTQQILLHMVREVLGYAVTIAGFAVAMYYITEFLERGQRYNLLLCAMNWSTPLQVTVMGVGYYLYGLDIFPETVANLILLILNGFVILYIWFILRAALAVSGWVAAGLTLIFFLICIAVKLIMQV